MRNAGERGVPLARVLDCLGGRVLAVYGPVQIAIGEPMALEAAGEGGLGFCSGRDAGAVEAVRRSGARAVLCRPEVAEALGGEVAGKTLVVVENPRLGFIQVVQAFFAPAKPAPGIDPTAVVAPDAVVDRDVFIGPYAVVGRCRIGAGSVVHGHAHLYSGVRLGRDVTVHAGCVIGADGFGYERDEAGRWRKFPHLGGVVVEDGVEIGANACIDRGALGDTVIREGAKIDNLVYIAHNVTVGRHAAVIALAAVCGSARIGQDAWVAPSAAVRDKVHVGDGATVGLGAVVVSDVPDGAVVAGVPARPLTVDDPRAAPASRGAD